MEINHILCDILLAIIFSLVLRTFIESVRPATGSMTNMNYILLDVCMKKSYLNIILVCIIYIIYYIMYVCTLHIDQICILNAYCYPLVECLILP